MNIGNGIYYSINFINLINIATFVILKINVNMKLGRKYDIFISYRRDGGFETANLIASKLKLSGYRVFLDIHSMHSGNFSEQLKEKVKGCKDFIWVLSPFNFKNEDGTVTRIETLSFREGEDYFRDEICWAIEFHKNIIPVILDGFVLQEEYPQMLQDTINAFNPSCNIHQLQAVEASKNQHFDASVSELKRYLHSYPIKKWTFIVLIFSFFILFTLLLSFFYNRSHHEEINEVVSTYEFKLNDFINNQVLIDARLLDTVFIKTDSIISQTLDYDTYMGIERESDRSITMGPFYDSFHYIDTCINGVHSIMPYGKYVSDYYLHDSIVIQDCSFLILGEDEYTNIHNPILDVSLVNNSDNTILVHELLIEVEESHTDTNPFVILYESGGYLFLDDRGWKSWNEGLLRFSLLPEGQQFDGKYLFEIPISSSEEVISIPLYDYFVQSGVDFSKLTTSSIVYKSENKEIPFWDGYSDFNSLALDTLKELLFPVKLEIEREYNKIDDDGNEIDEKEVFYKDPYLVLYGELIFDNKSKFKVGGTVRFMTSEGWGAPRLECSRTFDVKLRNDGKNYVIKYPVSHYLKAGDVDRFAIQIDADKTSYHTFKVRLHNVNQIDITTNPINLFIFKYNKSKNLSE